MRSRTIKNFLKKSNSFCLTIFTVRGYLLGQRIKNPNIEFGSDCTRCTFPTFDRFPAGETPKYVYACFWGIENCGFSSYSAPNGRIFRLPQDAGNPCMWYLDGSVWKVEFIADRIAPAVSRLQLGDKDGWSFFTGNQVICPDEYTVFNNAQGACILMYAGAGGHGTIWWNAELLDISEDFGIVPCTELFYDVFNIDASTFVHRFSDRRSGVSISIKKS